MANWLEMHGKTEWTEHTWRKLYTSQCWLLCARCSRVRSYTRTVQIFGVEKVIKTPFEINFRDAFSTTTTTTIRRRSKQNEATERVSKCIDARSLIAPQTKCGYYYCYKHTQTLFICVEKFSFIFHIHPYIYAVFRCRIVSLPWSSLAYTHTHKADWLHIHFPPCNKRPMNGNILKSFNVYHIAFKIVIANKYGDGQTTNETSVRVFSFYLVLFFSSLNTNVSLVSTRHNTREIRSTEQWSSLHSLSLTPGSCNNNNSITRASATRGAK